MKPDTEPDDAAPISAGDGPEGALRKIKRTRATGKYDAGQASAGDTRSEKEKHRGHGHGDYGDATTSNAFTARQCSAVGDSAAERAADGHGEEGKRGVESAGFQIQPANFRQINVKPTEENPGDVAVAEIAEGDGPDIFALQDCGPGQRLDGIGVRRWDR